MTTKRAIYKELAILVQAFHNCFAGDYSEWSGIHEERIQKLMSDTAPRGSGLDNGTFIDVEKSTGNKLVLTTSYHHMNDNGMYDGWTDHSIIVTPSLTSDFDLRITGSNRNDIKEYLYEIFSAWLRKEINIV